PETASSALADDHRLRVVRTSGQGRPSVESVLRTVLGHGLEHDGQLWPALRRRNEAHRSERAPEAVGHGRLTSLRRTPATSGVTSHRGWHRWCLLHTSEHLPPTVPMPGTGASSAL